MATRARKRWKAAAGWLALALLAAGAHAQQVAAAAGLAELSLEQLSDLPVTSVTGRPESLRTAPASVYVISSEDIRRSAATSLPEALRLAPNLQVARLNAGQYAISARGFNNSIANKLLVLVDGRVVYSAMFSGVFWDFHDLVLEDIDRIEVISGPGGTLWGANAVNGIINVITKPAGATQGTLVDATRSAHGGQEAARWGGKLGEAGRVRLYALAIDRDNTRHPNGTELDDAATKHQAGFRSDFTLPAGGLTVQGDIYRGGDDPASGAAPKLHDANLLARWESRLDNGGPYRLQAWYDLQARDEVTSFRNEAQVLDLEFTHEPLMAAGQQLLWGAGYRSGRVANDPSVLVAFMPEDRRLDWANVFAQYQRRFDRWQVTMGAKAERNTYTGVEFMPSVRAAYDHGGKATTWVALSRAVRAPSPIDRDFHFPGQAPYIINGGPDFNSEIANVLELGNRGQWGRDLSWSATLFRQQYRGLRAGTATLPALISNRIDGYVDGLEAWGQWQPAEIARFSLGYLGQRKNLHFADLPTDPTSIPNLGNDPAFQWTGRAQFDLPHRTELDLMARRVGGLPSPAVPAYTSIDLRLGWQATPRLELSLLAQNLLDERHVEFNATATASEFGRMVFLRAVLQL
ncbi:TonB-dependent receptor [Ramlibacter sp. G-1-2-2]|uniref:TonB-dependent receptor n=1 Tax=Ramlibacter agri TaxID=2728837 RepID=A0A848GUN9_9BURK|nr:TonB-dependent receptor [Ramlibacter agri]NML42335.1 TonB-dependent receptor [Ramlibacter agri]